MSETTRPDADAKDYLATKHICHACLMLSIRQDRDDDTKHRHSHLWQVERL